MSPSAAAGARDDETSSGRATTMAGARVADILAGLAATGPAARGPIAWSRTAVRPPA